MSDEGRPDLQPVFRSANPYADEVDAEDARGATSPPPAGWNSPTWSLVPQVQPEWGYAGAGGAWDVPPRQLPPAAPGRRHRPGLGVITAVLLACGAASVGVGAEVAHLTAPSGSAPTTLLSPQPGSGSGAPGAAAPAAASPAPSTSAAPTASPSPPTRTLTNAEIAAAVDPAVVDITSSLPNQGAVAAGTGMVITSSGVVLTNNHVITGAARIQVLIGGSGPTYTAHVVGADPAHDVAVIQIDRAPAGLKTVSVGDSAGVAVGDSIVALGNALGRQGTPSIATGTVTALDQTITASDQGGGNAETLSGLIQINARIQPGDSGGPLVNRFGQVVGMNSAAAVARRQAQGTTAGYAIPINAALSEAQQLEHGGGASQATPVPATQRALLGVSVQDGNTPGATVVGIQSGGPADSAGITAGDLITGLGGRTVDSSAALGSALRSHKPGDRVRVQWLDQSGRQHSATVTLASA